VSDSARDNRPELATSPSGGTYFVGRIAETCVLTDALERTLSGRPSLVLLAGDAGIGKTSLIRHSLERFRSDAIVSIGHCYEGLDVPYFPVIEAVRSCLEQCPDALKSMSVADGQLITSLARGGSVDTGAEETATEHEKAALSLAVSRFFVEAAQCGPVVILVDDVHWADGASGDLMLHIAYSVADASVRRPLPVLILCAYRPTDLSSQTVGAISRLEREPISVKLELEGLAEEEIREYVRRSYGVRPSQQLINALMDATGGNPLFLQAALAHLSSSGNLETANNVLVSRLGPEQMKIPMELTDAVRLRIGSLSAACREVLTVAACLGDPFMADELIACFEERETVVRALDEAIRERFVSAAGDALTFVHPLYRRALYDEASPPRRNEIHRRIAGALERLHYDGIETHLIRIANHLLMAGNLADPTVVVEYARAAGNNAWNVLAWGEAARLFGAAAERAVKSGEVSPHDVADLHYRSAMASFRDTDPGPTLEHLGRAVEGFAATNDTRGVLQAETLKARTQITIAPVPIGTMVNVEPLQGAIEAYDAREASEWGEALWELGQCQWHAGSYEKAIETAEMALQAGQKAGDDRLCAQALSSRGLARFSLLEMEDAVEDFRDSLARARMHEDEWLLLHALPRLCPTLISLGRLDEAWLAVDEACTESLAMHDWAEYSFSLAYRATQAHLAGDAAQLERVCAEGLAAARRSGYVWGASVFLPTLARSRLFRGKPDEAVDALSPLTEAGVITDDPGLQLTMLAQIWRIYIAAASGNSESARSLIGPFRSMLSNELRHDVHSLSAYCAMAEALHYLGEVDLLGALARPLYYARERGIVLCSAGGFTVDRTLGLINMDQGDFTGADAHFREALALAERWDLRPAIAQTCLNFAEMLRKRDSNGDRDMGARLLLRASNICEELGLVTLLGQAISLGEEMAADLRSAPPPEPALADGLSEREIEVLRLIAAGMTNRQIADDLVLSVKTVDRHVSNIFSKIQERIEPIT
jgi:ATP/maltotriose-dependent transcriptional regulator MalT